MTGYLAASIGLSDGRVIRVGPDESQVGDIPTSFSFETTMPGGFGPASLVIPRPPDLYADDARLFSSVVVYGEGMRIVYEGYVTGLPQQSQDEIQLQLTGWSTVLDRITNFRQIFVDRELGRWQPPPAPRRVKELNSPGDVVVSIEGPEVQTDASATPILMLEVTASAPPVSREAWFDAGPGLTISQLFVNEIDGNFDTGFASRSMSVGFTDSDAGPTKVASAPADGEVFFNSKQTNKTFTATTPTRYVYIRHWRSFPSETTARISVRGPAVIGNHNLLLSGTSPGVYGSEAIAYMVGATPLTLLPDSIEASDFVIPHLSFTTDISVREAIEQINVLGGKERVPNDWGVYDNREFFWRTPGTYGKTWRVTSRSLSNSRSDGPDSVLRTSGVKVNYQDAAGVTRSVGPPASFSDYETSDLLSIDPENPAFSLPGYHTESVGITSRNGAINIGRVLLNERNRLNWRGNVELQGEVMDSEGKTYPVHRVRAGDQIIVEDDDDRRPRPINSTSYSHDNMSLTASLGAVPDTLDSLLARLAAVTDLFV